MIKREDELAIKALSVSDVTVYQYIIGIVVSKLVDIRLPCIRIVQCIRARKIPYRGKLWQGF